MTTLCVSLGLNRNESEYRGLWDTLRSAPGYCRVQRSTWFIQTGAKPSKVVKACRAYLDANDDLLVFPADLSAWAACGVEKTATDWMKGVQPDSEDDSVVLCVSFDLDKDENEYSGLWETLQTSSAYCRIHRSAWFIKAGPEPSKVRDILQPKIGGSDNLLVFPADLSDWSSYVDKSVNEWLKKVGKYQSSLDAVRMMQAMQQHEIEMWKIGRVAQHNNEIMQMFSNTMNNINAGWDEVWAQNQKAQHEQHIRMLRAMSGSCPSCGCTCCRCGH